jgi:multidrug efflux pump
MTDVDTDQQENGVETRVEVDRDSASRLGLNAAAVDAALYNAFGQRQVGDHLSELNQYHVIMEWAPRFTAGAERPGRRVRARQGHLGGHRHRASPWPRRGQRHRSPPTRARAIRRPATPLSNTVTPLVPLAAVARFVERSTPTSIATRTASWRRRSRSTSPRADPRRRDARRSSRPRPTSACRRTVRGSFQGTAPAAQQSQGSRRC